MRLGFHGDQYLLALIKSLIADGKVSQFIETGTAHGHTLNYVATTYPHLDCFSCELDQNRFNDANKRCANSNAHIYNLPSPEFLNQLSPSKLGTLFWLDAHGHGFDWPLREEFDIITRWDIPCYVVVDDYRVPNLPQFGFDSYNQHRCEHEYVTDMIHWNEYELFYPQPYEHTSTFHPLRGWGLYAYNMPTKFIDSSYAIRHQ